MVLVVQEEIGDMMQVQVLQVLLEQMEVALVAQRVQEQIQVIPKINKVVMVGMEQKGLMVQVCILGKNQTLPLSPSFLFHAHWVEQEMQVKVVAAAAVAAAVTDLGLGVVILVAAAALAVLAVLVAVVLLAVVVLLVCTATIRIHL